MATLLTCAILFMVSKVSQPAALTDRNSQPQQTPTPASTLAPHLQARASPPLSHSEDALLVPGGMSYLIGGHGRLLIAQLLETSPPHTALFGAQAGGQLHPQGPLPVPTAQPTAGPTAAPLLPTSGSNSVGLTGVHTFQVVASAPCTSARTALVELTAQDLYGVLGTPDLRLAAADADEAQDFPNLLPLGDSPASMMKKADIVRELQKTAAAPSPTDPEPSTRGSASTVGMILPRPRPSAGLGVVNGSHASPLRRRTRQATSGVTTGVEYCEQQGQDGGTNFLSLCTTCALTTDLGPDRFPRYINEVVCGTSSCIFHRNQPMGRCKQRVLYIKMLRRRQGWCMTVQSGSQRLLSDFWETYDQPVRIACDCMMLRDSAFASFVKMTR